MSVESVKDSIAGESIQGVDFILRLALARIYEQSECLLASAAADDPMRPRFDDIKRDALNAATMLASSTTVALMRAMDSIEDSVAVFDEVRGLVFANRAYRRLLESVFPRLLLGHSYAEIHQEWREQLVFPEGWQRSGFVESPRSAADRTDWEVSTRDGRTLRIVARQTPDGGIVETIWDRTEEARLLGELRDARATAEAASAAKSEFLSSMSHELRTPLNAMLGFAQLLQRNAAGLAERHRLKVDQMLKAGEHVLRLVDDVLDLSRIEAGCVSIRSEPVDVFDVLTEVTSALGPAAHAAGVRVEVAACSTDVPTIAADRIRLAQILMNFGSNALKYNRPGGSATFGVSPNREFVRIAVADEGVGIPADKQAKLFRPFERAGQEAGAIDGTGIGLVIVKRLAERMGGRVGFRSVFQKGSEFWIDIPVHPLASGASGESGLRRAVSPPRG